MSIPTPHNTAKKGDIAKKGSDAGRSAACEVYCGDISGESGMF